MKKYYIYHIIGIKIGCTMYPKHRIGKAQKYNNYEILEIHTDIKIAADREIELQKQYGYKIDKKRYDNLFTIEQLKKGGINSAKSKKSKGEFFGGKTGGTRENMLKAAEIGRNAMIEKYGIKINAYDYQTKEFIKSFPSMSQAAKELNCQVSNVSKTLKGERNRTKNYFFTKVEITK